MSLRICEFVVLCTNEVLVTILIAVYHVPEMRRTQGSSLDKVMYLYAQCSDDHDIMSSVLFLIIGVEKNNDTSKRNYFSSNRHDAAV